MSYSPYSYSLTINKPKIPKTQVEPSGGDVLIILVILLTISSLCMWGLVQVVDEIRGYDD